jgi:hypothetical protein
VNCERICELNAVEHPRRSCAARDTADCAPALNCTFETRTQRVLLCEWVIRFVRIGLSFSHIADEQLGGLNLPKSKLRIHTHHVGLVRASRKVSNLSLLRIVLTDRHSRRIAGNGA